jgi:uncharacterized protein involved in exopolysaccharide biosynthesis
MGSFKQRNQVFSLDEQRSSLLKERDEVGVALKNEQIYVKALQEKIDFLKDRKNVFTDGVVTQLRSNLNGLEQKELELAVKYNDDSEMMADHRKEVQVVREQLRQHEEQVRNAEITKIAADLEPSKVKVAGLQKRYSDVVRDLQQMDARTREFEDLKRDAAVNESNYQIYLKKSEESRISDDLDRRKMTNVTVIERATVPITPVQSKKAKTLGIGAFLSIALSLGLAYAAEYLPHGMTTPQDAARRLGLPILVAIPRRQAARHTPRALRSQC